MPYKFIHILPHIYFLEAHKIQRLGEKK